MGNFLDERNLKTELGITSGDAADDALLKGMVDAVESLWDERTARTWFATAHTEYYDAEGGREKLFLRNWPVAASPVPTVKDDPDWVWGADTSLTINDDFRVDYIRGIVHNPGGFFNGVQSVQVVYTAGYTAAACPAWLKQALVRQAAHWYRQAKGSSWAKSSEAMPGGGTTSFKELVDNMLPDFVALADMHRRMTDD